MGITREEIVSTDKAIADNGRLSEILDDLEHSGFIRRYNAIGKKERNAMFQLVDNFTLFHFRFIQNNHEDDERFWTHSIDTPVHNA